MRILMHTEFTALLHRADVSQARFARLTGVTPRQVNNWARGRAAVPSWACLIAIMLEEHSPDALEIAVDAAELSWAEVLGIATEPDAPTIRRAMVRLASLYHPDRGGQPDQMVRVNAAYEQGQSWGSRYAAKPPLKPGREN